MASAGRKISSLKRRVPSHLARWEMKKNIPLWYEVHFEIKIYKTHQVRTKTHFEVKTFGSWDVEKMYAVVARSTFRRQNVQNTSWLLKVEMSKQCTPLWQAKHFEVKMHKIWHVRTTYRSYYIEKVHVVVARCIFQKLKVQKTDGYGTVLDVQICFSLVWQTQGLADLLKSQQKRGNGFVVFPKTMPGMGHLKRIFIKMHFAWQAQ